MDAVRDFLLSISQDIGVIGVILGALLKLYTLIKSKVKVLEDIIDNKVQNKLGVISEDMDLIENKIKSVQKQNIVLNDNIKTMYGSVSDIKNTLNTLNMSIDAAIHQTNLHTDIFIAEPKIHETIKKQLTSNREAMKTHKGKIYGR